MKKMKLLPIILMLAAAALLFTGFSRPYATATATPTPAAADGKNTFKLTIDDAKAAAFKDAGVKEKDVVLKKAGMTRDDGVAVYEVEFYYKDTEYEYDIDPNTGKITDLDKDAMDAEDYKKMEALQKAAEKAAAAAKTTDNTTSKSTDKSTDKSTVNKTTGLTLEDAKKIAFDDAGVKEKDVVLKRAGQTRDDGVVIYEIEFYYKDVEYEYDVDPNTGVIMDLDRDPMDKEDYEKMKALQKKATAKTTDKTGDVTLDEAKKIAFDDAGVKEKDAVLKKAALTKDDGVDEYEIDFYCKDIGYEYDIDPKTGIITDLDREPMDKEDYAEMKALQQKSTGSGSAATTAPAGTVNEDKAFEIALAHAKVSAADAYDKKVKLDYDDDYGREIYEVEFKAGGTEYSYDIDSKTGEILDFEAEADD